MALGRQSGGFILSELSVAFQWKIKESTLFYSNEGLVGLIIITLSAIWHVRESRYTDAHFQGAVLDTRASSSSIDYLQVKAYFKFTDQEV